MTRLLIERVGIVAAVLLLVLPPIVRGGPFRTAADAVSTVAAVAGACSLAWWRTRPRTVAIASLASFLLVVTADGRFPDTAAALLAAAFAVLALGWGGRAAWLVAAAGAAYLVVFGVAARIDSVVAALMLSVPPYLAGTALRLRRETAARLAERARELEAERELFAEIALRHERARIAGELHDIVGHAISVMVIQAAAGRRLVESDPVRAREALGAIAESAREGRRDLERLVALLGSGDDESTDAPDLDLVEEVVRRAGRSGLRVTCRWEGDRRRVPAPVGGLAFRVVQESLTNALRYAPGAEVHVAITVDPAARELAVEVENGPASDAPAARLGSGRGLPGLRERVVAAGGWFRAGPRAGGWAVEVRLPAG